MLKELGICRKEKVLPIEEGWKEDRSLFYYYLSKEDLYVGFFGEV